MATLSQQRSQRTTWSLVVAPSGASLRSVVLPEIGPDDVLLKVQCVGLCRTDLGVLDGSIATGSAMQVPGHEFSAIVEEIGPAVSDIGVGQRVVINPIYACESCSECRAESRFQCTDIRFMGVDFDGACTQQIVVPGFQVFPLPSDFSFFQAVFAEPIAAALAVCKIDYGSARNCVILGDNRIGLLTQRVLKAVSGIEAEVLDLMSASQLSSSSVDFVIESEGTTRVLEQAARLVRPRGTIVLKSRQQNPVALNLREMLVKEPVLKMVHYGRFEQAVDLLVSQRVKVDDLVGKQFPLEEFEKAVAWARNSETQKTFLTLEDC